MEARRYLRCLGQPALFGPAGEPIRFRTRKHLALLVYLAIEGRVRHRRDRLAEVFWPSTSLSESRHSLATALSVLRPRLGQGALVTDRETVSLTPGVIALDLERLAAGDILGSETTPPLEVAAFLDGFDIAESGEFGLWKDRQQARLLPAIKGAFILLIDRCRRTGDSRQIEQLADRMLAMDELSEEAIRAKMEARAFAGDRLTALQVFEEWKEKLADELGAAPSELVEGMAARLRRRGWERTPVPEVPLVPTDQWRGRPFIGRAAEYRVLYEMWEGMRKGVPGHALVLGDSGIGKTTLVGRLTTAAGLEGAVISRAQCYDLEREIPYATLGNLVHGLLDCPGVSATPPEALAELARTVPEVRRRFPSIPPPEESQGETARIRLTEAFQQMVEAIAEEHPVILVVDDLHLADDASLGVLHLVMRRVLNQPIMVVLIARPGELAHSAQAERLREAGRALQMREIEVPAMSSEESLSLLKSLLVHAPTQPNASVRRQLLKAGNGFPMVLDLLAHDWQANGERSLAISVNAMTAELVVGNPSVTLYGHVVERTGRGLDSGTRNTLNLAAVLGHRLNEFHLYSIVDLTASQTMASMSELANARLLRDNGHGLEFPNELLRTAAYLSIPSPLRRVLHSQVADTLIDEARRGTKALGLEIAWHCVKAGRTSEASTYLLAGAKDAIVNGALDSAERALSTALSHLPASARDQASLLLAEILQEQGRWSESSIALLEYQGRPEPPLATVFRVIAENRIRHSTPSQVRLGVEQLANISRSSAAPSVRLKAVRAASRLLVDLRDEELARDLLSSLNAVEQCPLSDDDCMQVALRKAFLLYHAGEPLASLECLETLVETITKTGLINSILGDAYAGLGALKCHEGLYRQSGNHYQNAFRVFAHIGNESLQRMTAAQVAGCYGRLGEYSCGIDWAHIGNGLQVVDVDDYTQLQLAYYEAFGLAMLGNPTQAAHRIDALDELSCSFAAPWLVQAWKLWKADIYYLTGHPAAAIALAKEGTHYPLPVLHANSFAGMFARWLALIAKREVSSEIAMPRLEDLQRRLTGFDALDQLEILLASYLCSAPVANKKELPPEIRSRLAQLPPAVSLQLQRLGLLNESAMPDGRATSYFQAN